MNLNIDWKVYMPNEKSTYPFVDSDLPILIYTNSDGQNYLKFYTVIFTEKGWVDLNTGENIIFDIPVFWRYIPFLPTSIKARVKKACKNSDLRCPYEDDGVCFDKPEYLNCPYYEEVMEYWAYT